MVVSLGDPALRIFAGSGSLKFARDACDYLHVELGKSEAMKFSEGNTFVRVLETVRGKDVFVIQTIGLRPNDEFMELLFWIDALKRASASSVTAVIPYFGYAKGDKKDEPRVSIRARVCAECAEVVGVDRVITMDLHSPQIQGFFRKPVDHLQALPILCTHIRSKALENMVVASPDAGFAKTARGFGTHLGVPVVIGDKIRESHDENARIIDIIGEVKGRNVVIVDDFAVSCGTLVDMARALEDRGAARIYACVSHALFNAKGLQKIEASPIEELIVTDTVQNDLAHEHPRVTVVSVAPLFAEAIGIVHRQESLSDLFNRLPSAVLEKSHLHIQRSRSSGSVAG